MLQVKPAAPLFFWRFANAEFDEGSRELRVAGNPVDMEPRPLEVLLQLLRHAGEVVTKEDLLDSVYGHRHLSDGALAQAIRRLRRALEDDRQTVITTVHRVGYKLAADVSCNEIATRRQRPLLLKAGDGVPGREHWKLIHTLGGSEVEVWLIEHEKTRARRVLKLCTDQQRLSALKREVTLFRVLKDTLGDREDLVAVLDWNFDARPYYIECEYGGITLIEWAELCGGLSAIPMQTRIEVIAAVTEAVAAAHSADVLHKDLKPTNVLAHQAADGIWRPRLIDFGSGWLMESDRLEALRITRQGFTQQYASPEDVSPFGTPLYLAPELAAGQLPTVQTDVYALGVMLYQIVVGDFRKPLATGWEDDVPDQLLRADISAATHGNPLKRMKSAAELAARLRTLDVRRISPDHRPAAVARGSRAWRTAAALVVAALFVAGAAWQFRHPMAERPATMPTSNNPEARDAYMHAMTMTHRRQLSVPDFEELIKTLRHAVALDPGFANAWALLAQQYAHLYFNHYDPEASRIGAERALAIAMRLQPDSPETLLARGYYSYWVDMDYAAANSVMLRVHESWPENIDATIALARIARRQGRIAEAARYFEEAVAREPANMEILYGAAQARLSLRQYPAALRVVNHALDILPNDVEGIGLKAHIFQELGDLPSAAVVLQSLANRPGDFQSVLLLAEQARLQRDYPTGIALWRAYLAKPEAEPGVDTSSASQELGHLMLMNGDKASARAILDAVRRALEARKNQLPSDPRPVAQLAMVYADLGQPDVAKVLADSAASFEVVKRDAARIDYIEGARARVAARNGDNNQAFASLNLLLTNSFDSIVSAGLLRLDPEWDRLRSDPRFGELLTKAAGIANQEVRL